MEEYFSLDLHTHSSISYDGGITPSQYRDALESNKDLCLAITDHEGIDIAVELYKEFGGRVIVGQEIMTKQGELIGLYLRKPVQKFLDLSEAIKEVKSQGGLLYIPHPFEKTRHGIQKDSLEKVSKEIDIVEVYNSRSKEPWLSKEAHRFSKKFNIVGASSSDAHGIRGLAVSYNVIRGLPQRESLIMQIKGGKLVKKRAPLLTYFDPLVNKLKKRFSN